MRWMSLVGLASLAIACQFDSNGFGNDGESTSVHSDGSTAGTTEDGGSTSATSLGDAEGGSASGSSTASSDTSTSGIDDETADETTVGSAGCGDQNGGCDPNASCEDDTGRVECTCNRGYEGNGQQCSVAPMLAPLRIELPCGGSCGGAYCSASNEETDMQTLTGEPGTEYSVTLRFRGVVEEKVYIGGLNDEFWNEGGTPNADNWNVYTLEISEPPQSYFLNSGEASRAHCEALDYERSVTIAHGATVTLTMNDDNNCAAPNVDDGGTPIVIPDIAPAPDTFDGQFVQVDVVDISAGT